MAEVRYRACGDVQDWRLAVEGDALVVLPTSVPPAAVETVWRKVGAGGIGSVLEALTGAFGTSLTAIPPFALAIVEAGGVRVAIRGALQIVVEDADGVQSVSGEGVATWTERFLPGVGRFGIAPLTRPPGEVLGAEGALPIRSGVVAMSTVAVDVDVAAAAVAQLAPALIPAPAAEPAPAPAPAPEPAPELVPATTASSTTTDASVDTWLPAETAQTADAASTDEYNLLWGETVARPVTADIAAEVETSDETIVVQRSAPAAQAPAAQASAAPTPPVPSTLETIGDHDGQTVAVADIRALRAAEREKFESTDSVPARRPMRGRIVLSTGRTVELDRPVVIGRRPKSTRTSGAELPTLVAVDSPEQDISRSHVEIRAEGEHVLVTDLDTTNGTVLLRVGQEPVRLHPGEPTMVITGDVLDLGDGVTVAFEDLP